MEDDNVSIATSVRSNKSISSSSTVRRKRKVKSPPKTPQRPHFGPAHIHKGLSQLGRTADGKCPAYLTLEVSGTNMSSTDALSSYSHLQVLKLRNNELADISALSSLQSLIELDASQNKLTQVLGYEPQVSSTRECNLRKADFSDNQINMMRDLSPFKRLQLLNLDRNKVENITGLQGMRMLNTLSMCHNLLKSCKGLADLAGLRVLNLEGNAITSLSALSSLSGLELLLAKGNRLRDLEGVQHMRTLRKLDVSDNIIPGLQEMSHAREASFLAELNTKGNPVEKCMTIRLHQVYMLPQVSILNEAAVSAEEKVAASNLHGADAEGLRVIRKKHFPNGELDDGGGALPPTAAGLRASQAQEEIAGASQGDPGLEAAFAKVDSFVKTLTLERAVGGGGVPALSDKLANVCGSSQVLLARACWRWVCSHVAAPRPVTMSLSVDAPLFGPGPNAAAAEATLLGSTTGTWAERAAWLFMQLARGCELEAVIIPGFWKGGRTIPPGGSLVAHNHSWAGVKVNGLWRLVDPAGAALHGGALAGPLAPFFTPPSVFIFSYFPLEAHWQLLEGEPLTLQQWEELPELSLSLFARGGRLLSSFLTSVNELPQAKEGTALNSLCIQLAVDSQPGAGFSHTLYDSEGRPVTAWPPLDPHPLSQQLAFQQFVAGPEGTVDIQYGAKDFKSKVLQMWTSFPEPGEYWLDVRYVADVPGGLPLKVEGISEPLKLHLVESDEILRIKIIVPDFDPHTPDDGILHEHTSPLRLLPFAHPTFTTKRGMLTSPAVDHQLEADMTETFKIVQPGATGVALAGPNGKIIAQLEPTGQDSEYSLTIQVPRVPSVMLVGYTHQDALQACGWVPLLTFQVHAQSQHITWEGVEYEVPHVDPEEPQAAQAADMFKAMDRNANGKVTRREMLLAFRRNRQIADILKLPHRVRLPDGTFEKFVEGFLSIDTSKLGAFSFNELCAYMGIQPSEMMSDDEDGSWEEEDEQEEGEEGEMPDGQGGDA